MTIKVLIDIFSMLEYKKFIQERDKEYLYNITDCYHVIENFILCDEIILDKNGVQLQDLSSLCNQHEDVIGYIDSTHLETPLYKTLSGHNLNYMIHDVIKQN